MTIEIVVPKSILIMITFFLAGYFFRKVNDSIKKDGWTWILTGATISLMSEALREVGWAVVGIDVNMVIIRVLYFVFEFVGFLCMFTGSFLLLKNLIKKYPTEHP